jgi:hypothetical protein
MNIDNILLEVVCVEEKKSCCKASLLEAIYIQQFVRVDISGQRNLELYYGSDSKCAAICAILSWARLFFLTSITDRSLSTYAGLPAFRLVVQSRRKLKDRHVWT